MPATDVDGIVRELFLTPEGRRDPYPRYHRLRDAAPVHRSDALGAWLLTRYDDCHAALRDPRLGKDYARQMERNVGPDWRRHPSLTVREHSMLNVDGPEHLRLRRLVVKAFTRRTIDALRPSIERTVTGLLRPLAEAGGGDVLEAVGFPLPVAVIGEMLGVPEADRPPFRALVRDVTAVLELRPTAEQLDAADAATAIIRSYFERLIADKRRRPGDDLLSRLVHVEDGGDRLSDDELETLASLLFGAGFETTTNLIGNGLLGLLRHPEELDRLRAEPALFANLPDELLRFDGTAQLAGRYTRVSVDVGGVTIPAGEGVLTLLGAANHDPAHYADPDRLDVTRTAIEPLSFGGGVHYCLGALLVQAEIEATVRTLLARFGTIELRSEPRFRDRLTLRGLEVLDVTCRVETPTARRYVATAARPAAPMRVHQAPRLDAAVPVLGVRPRVDGAWRAALRSRVEGGEAIGRDLAAKMILLGRTSLFRRCTLVELEELAATAYPMSFETGDLLCVQGADSLECYVIAEGEAVVTIDGHPVSIAKEDDVIGERGPLAGAPRAATVTAATHVNTWAISRERLLGVVARNTSLAEWMHAEMQRRYGP